MDDDSCAPPANSHLHLDSLGPGLTTIADDPPPPTTFSTLSKPRYDPHTIPFDPVIAKGHSVTPT